MHVTYRNINHAFRELVNNIDSGAIPTRTSPSRNGEVLVVEEPVIVTYLEPRERVLFNQSRDCNPVFHVFESMWMLAGRNDLAPLKYYVSTFDQYSDDGATLNGAYGHRWRKSQGDHYYRGRGYIDQLNVLIEHLKKNPTSRRAVLDMWSVEDDLLKVDTSRDVCCNLNAMFSLVMGPCEDCDGGMGPQGHVRVIGPNTPLPHTNESGVIETCETCKGSKVAPSRIDMTVTNRSNDMILGMLGANACHFSFLQEYMAARLGVRVGVYNQFTNNMHVYTKNWKPEEWLKDYEPPSICTECHGSSTRAYLAHGTCHVCGKECWNTIPDFNAVTHYCDVKHDEHSKSCISPSSVPLVHDPVVFDEEVRRFIDNPEGSYTEPFLRTVAGEMCLAFRHHKERDYGKALEAAGRIAAQDWRIATLNWITKRQKGHLAKLGKALEGVDRDSQPSQSGLYLE